MLAISPKTSLRNPSCHPIFSRTSVGSSLNSAGGDRIGSVNIPVSSLNGATGGAIFLICRKKSFIFYVK
jgi:hypothetical protein